MRDDNDRTEVNVAIVALIISLIALFVTANQLLVQLFSSAEGYRRCAESVIDVWHVKRKRVWKWSEFRFETQYVTPQIVLLSPLELEDLRDEYEEVYLINHTDLQKEVCKELNDTVHQEYGQLIRGKRLERSHTSDIERTAVPVQRRGRRGNRRSRPESDPLVSWLRLLRELHQLAYSYWPDDCKNCTTPIWDKVDTGFLEMESNDWKDKTINGASNTARTDIAVIYRTWTWDFMPPDIVRPLAEINVGDVIILALRMGMHWRFLDPEFGKMQADGNGFNLTAVDVKGLGLVLRFTASAQHDRYPRLIPSRAVDKMLLGIIPGDPVLVRQDFPMVESNSTVQNIASPGGILSKMGVPENRRRDIASHAVLEVNNDTMTLLMPFLPLEGSTMTRYVFPGWECTPGIVSIYCFWEGRIAIHRKLKDRINDDMISARLNKKLGEVLDRMNRLEQKHGDDWYSRFAWSPSIRNGQNWETKRNCINDAREVFAWTQKYFIDNGYSKRDGDGRTRYLHLVAAHANLADHAMQEQREFIRNYRGDRSQPALKKDYNITHEHGFYFVFDLYESGRHYVKHLRDEKHGVWKYLCERGVDISAEEAEEAWWVMQLRGIAWNFSTWHPDNGVKEVLGEPIPSTFYGNKSPVWIT